MDNDILWIEGPITETGEGKDEETSLISEKLITIQQYLSQLKGFLIILVQQTGFFYADLKLYERN